MNRYRCPILVAVLLLCASCGGVAPSPAPASVVTATAIPAVPGSSPIQVLEVDAPRAELWEAEAKRLAAQRVAKQEAVKEKYEREAKARAQMAAGTAAADPVLAFNRELDLAERHLAEGKFSAALRSFDRAMSQKPPDLPVSERAQALEARLKVEAAPVEVTLKSDGETYVSISAVLSPQKIYRARVKLVPGDYEVKGQRRNYPELTINLRVRNGEPPPGIISVICN